MKQFIKNGMLVGGTILTLTTTSMMGAENTGNKIPYDQDERYRSSELSLDLFGSASLGKYSINHLSGTRIRQNTRLGAGAGLSYFVTRYIGLGAEAYSENTTGVLVDSVSANVIGRFPLGQSGFAPYAYGGGGRQFDMAKVWFAQMGAGMEYRFTPRVGAFIDARWVLPDETKYYGVARLGMRFGF